MATSSSEGTLVRIFDTKTTQQINELRRGGEPATIFNIKFRADSKILMVTSNKGTLHLFSLEQDMSPYVEDERWELRKGELINDFI
jgi:WD repeat-containing protein 45